MQTNRKVGQQNKRNIKQKDDFIDNDSWKSKMYAKMRSWKRQTIKHQKWIVISIIIVMFFGYISWSRVTSKLGDNRDKFVSILLQYCQLQV